MHFHNRFLILIIQTLMFNMTTEHSNAHLGQIVSEFFSDDPAIRFESLAVDENGGWVYVGASNTHLYQLSADLKSQINYTSMEFNSSINCTRKTCIYASNNDGIYCRSTVLESDYQNQQVISCHNCLYNNRIVELCRAHSISNISEILTEATKYNILLHETKPVTFIGPSLIKNSSALYYGFNFPRGTAPKITIRHLDQKRFLSYDKQIIMHYYAFFSSPEFICGFNSGDSSYFLTKEISVNQYVTIPVISDVKLIEIRHKGQNYQLDEVPLRSCTGREYEHIWLKQAYFYEHKSGSELETDSHEIQEKILFVVFSVPDKSDDGYRRRDFIVCAYNMSNLHYTIRKRKELHGEIIYDYASNINVTSVTVTSINNHIVLFIGTEQGHLHKISIRLDSSHAYMANIYANITVDDEGSSISNMLFDSKKNFLYALTEKKLAKIKIHNCDKYDTSYSCLSAKDPYCGWCFRSNICCLKSECSNYEQNRIEWISYDIDKYVNTSSSPRQLFSRKAQWNVTFNLLNSLPFHNHKIMCSFRFNSTIINTTTSVRNENKINCLTPNPKDIPPILNGHSIRAQLSVQTNHFPEFRQIAVAFFDCSEFKSCLVCVSYTPCNWHLNEHKCADEAVQSSDYTILGDNFDVSEATSGALQNNMLLQSFICPSFQLKSTQYIHANTRKKERITGLLGIPKILINETFTCKFDTEENITITPVSLRINNLDFAGKKYMADIKCDTMFTYAAPKSSIAAKWSILWNGSIPFDNLLNKHIVLYKCANMGNQCAKCLDKKYKCMWNSKTGECKYNNSSDVESDHNNHWLNDKEECLNVPFKNQSNWLTDNVYWIIIIIIAVTLVTVAIFFSYCRNSAEKSRTMQRQLNKMGMEMIAMSQWVKRVVIENEMDLDENESNMLRLPNVTIQYTTIPRFAENETVPKDEYELPPDHRWEIPRKNVILGKCLGEGQFGKVVEGKVVGLLQQNVVTTAAVKMLKNSHTDADMVNLVTEMQLMKIIGRHENVLGLLGCCTIDGPTLLIIEYSSRGNLLDFLQKNHHSTAAQKVKQNDLSEEVLITFALQIAKGMEYLASIGFVHRDLAARNILVFDNNVVKIADFGLARDIRQADYYKLKTGGKLPVKWMSPEALMNRRHTSKSDVWSYGVLLWEIMTLGDDPYPLYNDAEKLMEDIETGYRLKKPANCSINMYSLMCKCWLYLPEDRPEFTNIIKHLDAILTNCDKTIEQPDLHGSSLSTESDDTEDETNDLLV